MTKTPTEGNVVAVDCPMTRTNEDKTISFTIQKQTCLKLPHSILQSGKPPFSALAREYY